MRIIIGNKSIKLSEKSFCKNVIKKMYGGVRKTKKDPDIEVKEVPVKEVRLEGTNEMVRASENIFVDGGKHIIKRSEGGIKENLASSLVGSKSIIVEIYGGKNSIKTMKVYYDKETFEEKWNLLNSILKAKDWSFSAYDSKVCKNFTYEVFEPVIQQELLASNATFLHAASIEINGAGVLLTGWGGAGKTSTSNALLKDINEAKFMSDDLSIVDSEGLMYPYLKSSVVYPYNTVGGAIDEDTFIRGSIDKMNWVLRKNILGYKAVRRRVKPETLYSPNRVCTHSTSIEKIIYVSRVRQENISHSTVKPDEMARRSAAVMIDEMDGLTKYLSAACSVGEDVMSVSDLFLSIQDCLEDSFHEKESYSLKIPFNCNPQNVSRYIIENIL